MQDELTQQVAADLGIGTLPEDKQKELIAQFGEIALKAATMAIMSKLSESARASFMQHAETGDSTALQTLLDAELPDHETVARNAVAEEIKRFKEFSAA